MRQDFAHERIDLWIAEARAGGPGAARAARRAAALAEYGADTARALAALKLAARLDPIDPAPRLTAARLYAEAGNWAAARAEAEAVLAEAVDQAAHARAAFMLGELARAQRDDSARGHYEAVLRIEGKLLDHDRSDPEAARWYARARGRLAELDAEARQDARALAGAEGALAMLRGCAAQLGETPILAADIADAELRLAALELDDRRASSARRRLGEAIGRYEALAVAEPGEPHWRAMVSDAWALAAEADYERGAPSDARAAMDRALQARIRLAVHCPQESWALAGIWRTRAALLAALGEHDAAADSLKQARALAAQLAVQGGEAQDRFLIHTLLDQADHALRTGALALAKDAADAARMRAEAHARKAGADHAWFGEAGACWDRLGELARLAHAREKALEGFTRAAEFRRMACERAPESQHALRGLAAALVKLGDAALAVNAGETARAALGESVRLRLALADAAPQDAAPAHALATALERFGFAALACGDAHAARGAWEDELALAERMFAEDALDGQRFRAIVESHLVGLGGPDAEMRRHSALARFDQLAQAGMLTTAEAALRKTLWGG